ncbi:DUF1501 domain-containing protein [Vibrio genomosp. F10]|uniref:DUF1501 domain-containing protein n=1 Tax=Vibrio genomosp. F10 TaxID=723171 RepID=UPI000312023E|nr:DUF1501 domain-containing protein [Vibrio genomosp. F10]OEE97271.1 Tat pathway signal protein [Vibrio genomosp. F10 str. 9ZD137]
MNISRRSLLTSFGGMTVGSLLPNVSSANHSDDFKALVCIHLAGGNDSVNTVIPTDQYHYDEYKQTRPAIAVSESSVVPITQTALDNQGKIVQLGLHPKLAKLANLFNQHRAMVVLNSGILKEPLTKQEIENNIKPLPPQLFSHNSQTYEWEKGAVGFAPQFGWAGRMLDVLGSHSAIAPLYSITNKTLWLRSLHHQQNILKPSGTAQINALKNTNMESSYNALTTAPSNNPFTLHLRNMMGDAMHISQTLDDQVNSVSNWQGFTNSSLGKQFQFAYKLIKSQKALNQARQVLYLKQSGYDLHDNQLIDHPLLLADLATNLMAFDNAMSDNGLSSNVTSFTTSEFGRRLASNGKGTDHGWGGHQFILGGAVNTSDAVGTWPEIRVNGADDISNGRLVPTLGTDQVNATLARWMGVNNENELNYVFPNIHHFASSNLGFLS